MFDRVECHVTAQRSPLWYIIRSRILVYSYCILLVILVVRNYHNPIIVWLYDRPLQYRVEFRKSSAIVRSLSPTTHCNSEVCRKPVIVQRLAIVNQYSWYSKYETIRRFYCDWNFIFSMSGLIMNARVFISAVE